jgi:hypothetical protein
MHFSYNITPVSTCGITPGMQPRQPRDRSTGTAECMLKVDTALYNYWILESSMNMISMM